MMGAYFELMMDVYFEQQLMLSVYFERQLMTSLCCTGVPGVLRAGEVRGGQAGAAPQAEAALHGHDHHQEALHGPKGNTPASGGF